MLFAYLFFKSSYFPIVDAWIKTNIVLYVIALFIYKSIGVLFPPIPAGVVTLASIPFLGWFGAYMVDMVGSIFGGIIAYWLGKKYGKKILEKLFDASTIEKIVKTKVKKGKEIEAVFMFRVLLGSTILEAVYYGAGFLKIPFGKFLIGATLSHILVGVPSFLLANNIFSGKNIILTIVLSVVALIFVLKTKGRYFE
jgi:uncharacterized membrane protein YdjX (TVP38/TMEM64 family)